MSEILERAARAVGADPANQPRRSLRGPRRAARVPFAALVVVLAVGGMALLLALNTASAANELRRHDLATKDTSVAAQLQQVHNDVAASAAPGNLGRAARSLGMVPAGAPAFVVLEPDGSVRVLGKPSMVQGPPAPVAPTPKPSTSATASKSSATASKTTTKSKSKSKSKATKSTSHATRAASKHPASKHPASKHPTTPPSRPTSTPTPTVTLPGGDR